jgi:predicted protein tyrosine phosphatase
MSAFSLRNYMATQWRRVFGLNISPVAANLFVGGQFAPTQWPALHALGVRAVLSMQAEYIDRFSGAPEPQFMRLIVPDFHAPTLEQIDEGVHFMRTAHVAGLPVLVHCHAGVGRAPLMAAAYLMASLRIDRTTALEALRAARPIIALNQRQYAQLDAYAARLAES